MRNLFRCAAWAGGFIVVLSGCASAPEYRYYTVDMQPHAQLTPAARVEGVRVVVNQALNRPEIMIRTSPTQIEYYALDRWAAGLDEQIRQKISAEFAVAAGELPAVEIICTLMAFEQVDTPAGPQVRATIDATIQSKSSRPIISIQKLYTVEEKAAAPGAAAAVEALSRAVEGIARLMAADIAAAVAQPSKN